MPVERLGNRLLEVRSGHRFFRQAFQQDLPLVEETGGAVPALKGKMLDERFLQSGQGTILRMAFDRRMALPLKLAAETTQVGLV